MVVRPVATIPSASCGAGGERVTVRQPGQSGIAVPKAAERLFLTPVHDELGCATKQLNELGGQLPLSNRPGPRRPAEKGGGDRDSDPAHEQARRENDGRDGQDRGCDTYRGSARQDGHERRSQPPQIQGLQRIDVADHATHEIAAPVRLEPTGRERLDALVEAHAKTCQDAEGEIVGYDALEVAGNRSGETEEAHGDDDRRQREDRGTLGSPRDEIPRGSHQADAERDRERSEHD